MFDGRIVPAFQAVAAQGRAVKSLPQSEVACSSTGRGSTEPALALARRPPSRAPSRASHRTRATSSTTSPTPLEVARADAAMGRTMFVFLGLRTGAGCLPHRYAGSVLAATQQREHAILRLRGADRAPGPCAGLAGRGPVGHRRDPRHGRGLPVGRGGPGKGPGPRCRPARLGGVGLVRAGVGMLATLLALGVPGARSLRGEICLGPRHVGEPRSGVASTAGGHGAVAGAAVAEAVAVRSEHWRLPPAWCRRAESVSLRPGLQVAPLIAWLGAPSSRRARSSRSRRDCLSRARRPSAHRCRETC